MPRLVELIFRANNTSAIRALTQISRAADGTASQVDRAFQRQQAALRKTGAVLEGVGRGMTLVGGAMIGVGAESAKMAINFQKSMEMIHTQAGASQSEVNKLQGAVINLAKSGQVSQGPQQIADSLYHLESVGLRLNTGVLPALKIALQGAAVGGSDAEQTTSALAALWRADMPGAGRNFSAAMGVINATVGQGNMRMQDLVQALGTGVMPAFKNAGLNVYDAGAALATFADAGYNVSSASSQMATALHFLYQPTAKAQKALAAIGMSSYQMAEDMHQPNGLLVAMKDLKQHLSGLSSVAQEQVLGSILPGGRGRIMLTLLNNLDTYSQKLTKIHQQTGDFHKEVNATQQTMAFKLHAAWAKIQADMVQFGTTLLPIISTWLPKFTSAITGILGWITNLSPQMKSLLGYMAVGFAIGGPILIGLGKMLKFWAGIRDAIKAIKAMGKVSALLGLGGGAGGAGGIGASAAMDRVAVAANAAAEALTRVAAAGGVGVAEGTGVGASAGTAVAGAGKTEVTGSRLARFLGAARNIAWPIAAVAAVENTFGSRESSAHYRSAATGQQVYNPRVAAFLPKHFGHHAGGVITGPQMFQAGGMVDNVPAWLTAGEGVLNTTAMANLGAGGLGYLNNGGDIGGLGGLGGMSISASPVYLMLDGRTIAQSVIRYTLQRGARGPSSLIGGSLMTGTTTAVQRG